MSLPVIETPIHSLTLPLSKTKVKYRPFLVKEQKILLHAVEMNDGNALNNAIEAILKACTFEKTDIYSLPVIDVEYLLLNIRAKSVGEVIELEYMCKNEVLVQDAVADNLTRPCNTKITTALKIPNIRIKIDKTRENKIMFSQNVGIIMTDLKYGDYLKSQEMDDGEAKENFVLNCCIESIFTPETVYQNNDYTNEELAEFVGNLQSSNYEKIEEFATKTPKLEHVVKLQCPKCKHKEEVTLSGLDDFLE